MNKIATRESYGKALAEIGEHNIDIVVLDADLSKSTKTADFAKKFPERFFNVGISEQDLMGTAAGLATCGKIPFASSFAIFATGRAFEQIRNSIAYPKLNVKIAATHAGITVGEDGATHQSVEDIAIMRAIPGMVVINPADDVEARAAVKAAAEYKGPVYIRLGRLSVPVIYEEDNYRFEIGKGIVLKEGKDVTIIATGIMVAAALEAYEILKGKGIEAKVIDIHTIKPIDEELIIKAARETGAIVTAEEHSIIGGLGSAICEVVSERVPVSVRRVGIKDQFGQSGKPDELLKLYHLTPDDIVEEALKAIELKKRR
ncbi:transketolase [Caldanaerobius fijiensis DSM 17918]|uniref:Transketolase n=1 Tax=Caldanaerobius fijiensis DSM 17918 TaxID=1121256 RepID=A0A1M5DAU7_9THEO|nr:transketolase family protein [Caldanaerobius fijiensis]SHF64020.1 transketolase [Caldanaerobius fijiensis DSM 17918]